MTGEDEGSGEEGGEDDTSHWSFYENIWFGLIVQGFLFVSAEYSWRCI